MYAKMKKKKEKNEKKDSAVKILFDRIALCF